MRKSLKFSAIIGLFFFLFTETSYSANEDFRSIASGNWNSTSTWEMSTNNGSTWIAATITPDNTSDVITIRSPNTVTVSVNVSADQITVAAGGEISINTGITFTLLDGSSTDFTLLNGATVSGSGLFQTQGVSTTLNLRDGSSFLADVKVNSGTTTIQDQSSPFRVLMYGKVTIDNGAVLFSGNSAVYKFYAYGNVVNNGLMSGTGSVFVFLCDSISNNGSITGNFDLDTVSALSGTGTFTSQLMTIGGSGDIKVLNNMTFTPSNSFTIETGGNLNFNSNTLTINLGTFVMLTGSSTSSSGTLRTQGTVAFNLRSGSSLNASVKINTGTTTITETSSPFFARIYGTVTIDNGATLFAGNSSAYKLELYKAVTNNGTLSGSGSNVFIKGNGLYNNNNISVTNLNFDTTTAVTGAGSFSSNTININTNGNVVLYTAVIFSPGLVFTINSGGKLNPNGNNCTFNSGTLEVKSGGTVINSGLVRTSGTVTINFRSGSAFNANLNIVSGTSTLIELTSPFEAKLFGNLTIDPGATIFLGNSSSYSFEVFGTVINNGVISGNGSIFISRGSSFQNNGSVTVSNFDFNSVQTISGAGSYTSNIITIDTLANVTLLNNVTFSPNSYIYINDGGVLNPNLNIFKVTSGNMTVFNGGTVSDSGIVHTEGTVHINTRTGSAFNAALVILSGTSTVNETSSPFDAKIFNSITINPGASMYLGNSSAYSLEVYGDLTNNGTIYGTTGSELIFAGTVQSFQGTGICNVPLRIFSGSAVTMNSGHPLYSVAINAGGSYDISNNKVSFTKSDPIIQNGTFITANSDIEYNGTVNQQISTQNINYEGMKINNPAGVYTNDNFTISDTLSVILGDLNIKTNIITFTPDGYLTETPGNLIYGTSGYIITTRTLGAPSSLNVAGFGAVLTTATSLGSTEIRRGHALQTGLNGGTSIKRYYDISPTTNSGLNATLVYKYDPSELNGKPESSLQLFKSTNSGSTWLFQGGNLNYAAKEITLTGLPSFSRWSADSSAVSASITMIMEAFYNSSTNRLNMSDTVKAKMRNTLSPYAVVDSAVEIVDYISLKAAFKFDNLLTGTYYLQMNHRNTIETWSKVGIGYTDGTTLNYDFTFAANMAFGDNQKQVDTSPLRFAFWSGDVNQDGIIDVTDGGLVDNDAANFVTGYVPTDVNGDDITDLADAVYVDNNGFNFIGKITP